MNEKTTATICVICQTEFLIERKNSKKQTCSTICRNKLGKINAKAKNTLQCQKCHNLFQAASTRAKYCNRIVKVNCQGCENVFERKCNGDKGSYCSTSCRNSYMRKNLYVIKATKQCNACGDSFTPTTSGQIFCQKPHYRTCKYCNDEFLVQTNSNKMKNSAFCSNACSTFAQMGSQFDKTLLKDYRNINQWAITFKEENKRKPKLADFILYFNLRKLPSHADKKLFSQTRDSKLELIVLYYLKEHLPQLKITRHYREKLDNKWREIDLYFPEIRMGIEIQDFATHCREISNEYSKFNNPMKDLRYHEEKRQLFENIGITVFELWEDDIKSGEFDKIVEEFLAKAEYTELFRF